MHLLCMNFVYYFICLQLLLKILTCLKLGVEAMPYMELEDFDLSYCYMHIMHPFFPLGWGN